MLGLFVVTVACGSGTDTSGTGGGGMSALGGGGTATTSTGRGGDGGAGGREVGVWARGFGSGDTEGADNVIVDSADNIVVSGHFDGSVDFGGGPLSTTTDGVDAFLVKLGPEGGHAWSRQFGTTSGFHRIEIALAPGDGVVAAGTFGGTFVLDGTSYDAGTGNDLHVSRWSSDGQLQSLTVFPCTEDSFVTSVAVDGEGNAIVGGQFRGTCTFGGTDLTAAITDGFVAKLDATGTVAWARQIGGAATGDAVWGVGVDAQGNVTAGGRFREATDFGDGTPITPNGTYDLFVARYGADGTHVAHRAIDWEGTGFLDAFDLVVDADGRVLLAGQFASMTFETPLQGGSDGNQVFLAALNSAHTTVFATAFGVDDNEDHVRGIGVGDDGSLAVAGLTTGADFGGGALPPSSGEFAAVLSPTGAHVFSERLTSTFGTFAEDAALDHSGHIVVVGAYTMPVDFGSGTLTPSGPQDLFVLRRALP